MITYKTVQTVNILHSKIYHSRLTVIPAPDGTQEVCQ